MAKGAGKISVNLWVARFFFKFPNFDECLEGKKKEDKINSSKRAKKIKNLIHIGEKKTIHIKKSLKKLSFFSINAFLRNKSNTQKKTMEKILNLNAMLAQARGKQMTKRRKKKEFQLTIEFDFVL